ncbi:MAG: cytochrome C biogenesis protein CcdA [Limimaricola sp.]|uniref:cytochrome c-type biogenesis protein n=1 Tax=Limimaricola sp. TaxID=2211665 RepID=UPI001E1AF31D|nr:cytochrome c-type biogenesis protein [Limimaricola sp.]MBI1416705.1 cytochrome C biogenesis protein CcdA [Limimaricola sp.]
MMRALILVLALLAGPAFAVQPDEMLKDPALEARAREISSQLRCPVCLNESIDDSNATVSRDLRLRVRDLLKEGLTNQQVIDYLVYGKPGEFAGFGEFILMDPPKRGANLILWLAAPTMLILGLGLGYAVIRRRRNAAGPEALSTDEEARLQEILRS